MSGPKVNDFLQRAALRHGGRAEESEQSGWSDSGTDTSPRPGYRGSSAGGGASKPYDPLVAPSKTTAAGGGGGTLNAPLRPRSSSSGPGGRRAASPLPGTRADGPLTSLNLPGGATSSGASTLAACPGDGPSLTIEEPQLSGRRATDEGLPLSTRRLSASAEGDTSGSLFTRSASQSIMSPEKGPAPAFPKGDGLAPKSSLGSSAVSPGVLDSLDFAALDAASPRKFATSVRDYPAAGPPSAPPLSSSLAPATAPTAPSSHHAPQQRAASPAAGSRGGRRGSSRDGRRIKGPEDHFADALGETTPRKAGSGDGAGGSAAPDASSAPAALVSTSASQPVAEAASTATALASVVAPGASAAAFGGGGPASISAAALRERRHKAKQQQQQQQQQQQSPQQSPPPQQFQAAAPEMALAKDVGAGDAATKAEPKDRPASPVACNDYRIDLAAAAFGQCKCGFTKAEHAPSAVGPGGRGQSQQRSGPLLPRSGQGQPPQQSPPQGQPPRGRLSDRVPSLSNNAIRGTGPVAVAETKPSPRQPSPRRAPPSSEPPPTRNAAVTPRAASSSSSSTSLVSSDAPAAPAAALDRQATFKDRWAELSPRKPEEASSLRAGGGSGGRGGAGGAAGLAQSVDFSALGVLGASASQVSAAARGGCDSGSSPDGAPLHDRPVTEHVDLDMRTSGESQRDLVNVASPKPPHRNSAGGGRGDDAEATGGVGDGGDEVTPRRAKALFGSPGGGWTSESPVGGGGSDLGRSGGTHSTPVVEVKPRGAARQPPASNVPAASAADGGASVDGRSKAFDAVAAPFRALDLAGRAAHLATLPASAYAAGLVPTTASGVGGGVGGTGFGFGGVGLRDQAACVACLASPEDRAACLLRVPTETAACVLVELRLRGDFTDVLGVMGKGGGAAVAVVLESGGAAKKKKDEVGTQQ